MMKRISAFIISMFCLACSLNAQDTIDMPLKVRVGFEVSGPAMYFFNNDIFSAEGQAIIDLDEKRSVMIGTGYLNYRYSQYNYDYLTRGVFLRAGMDFNLLGPDKSKGIYWAGIGLHYGLTAYSSEVPSFRTENYWGNVESSIPARTALSHFIEVAPGVRAEVLKNVSIGWTVSLRFMVYSGSGNDNTRPLYVPGFGNASNRSAAGIGYFITWNIPYKNLRVITKPPTPEEEEEEVEEQQQQQSGSPGSIFR